MSTQTRERRREVAETARQWLGYVEAQPNAGDIEDLRELVAAIEARTAVDDRLANAVTACRENDRPWRVIAAALGMTRQAVVKLWGPAS